MILNTLRMYNTKYRDDYGQMVLCCDGGNVWRKQYFPNYKASRAKGRSESSVDWNEFFRILNQVREEIREFIPFKVVHVQGAEADDVIATLVESTQEFGRGENVMIISADNDFMQLQKYSNVRQFSPMTKKLLKDEDPIRNLHEKILRGDSGDGVPNVLSDNDVFIRDGARQTPLSSKKVNAWLDKWDELDNDTALKANLARNTTMIDLACIPQNIREQIMNQSNNAVTAPNSKVLNYLINKRCSMLIECASDFFVSNK